MDREERREVGSEDREQQTVKLLTRLVSEMMTVRRILALHYGEVWALPEPEWRAELMRRARLATPQASGPAGEPQTPHIAAQEAPRFQ